MENLKHFYIVRVATGELVGYYEDVEVALDEYVSPDNEDLFYGLSDVIDAGDDQLAAQNAWLYKDDDYDDEDVDDMFWTIRNITYMGTHTYMRWKLIKTSGNLGKLINSKGGLENE